MHPVLTSRYDARRPLVAGALLSFCCLVLLCGCGKEEDWTPQAAAGTAPTDPEVMLVVNGAEIRRDEIEASVGYFSRVYPEQDTEAIVRFALNEDLIPLAAVRSHYSKIISAKRAEIDNMLAGMAESKDTLRTASKQFRFNDAVFREIKEAWYTPDTFKHSTQGIAAFDTPKGELSEPFITSGGIHVLQVIDRTTLGDLSQQSAKLYQVIARFDTVENLTRTIPQVRAETRVTWVHPDYENYVSISLR